QRRAAQAGDAADGRRLGLAGDVALAAVARLAQGGAEVDQAGRGDQAIGVQRLAGFEAGRRLADGDDLGGVQIEVGDPVQAAGGVDDAGTEDTGGRHQFCYSAAWSASSWRCAVWPLMAMDMTAMRTAMP